MNFDGIILYLEQEYNTKVTVSILYQLKTMHWHTHLQRRALDQLFYLDE